jgi:hypothetical protein
LYSQQANRSKHIDDVLADVIDTTSANSVESLLVPALLKDGALVPEGGGAAADAVTAKLVTKRVKMWSRALHKFSDTWPHLIPLLLTALFREIRVVAVKGSTARGLAAVGAPVGGQAVDPHTSAAFSVRAIEPGRRQRHTLTWLGSWANVLIKEFPLGPCFSRMRFMHASVSAELDSGGAILGATILGFGCDDLVLRSGLWLTCTVAMASVRLLWPFAPFT